MNNVGGAAAKTNILFLLLAASIGVGISRGRQLGVERVKVAKLETELTGAKKSSKIYQWEELDKLVQSGFSLEPQLHVDAEDSFRYSLIGGPYNAEVHVYLMRDVALGTLYLVHAGNVPIDKALPSVGQTCYLHSQRCHEQFPR